MMTIHFDGYLIFVCIHVFYVFWVCLFTSRSPTNMKCNTRMCDKFVCKKFQDQLYMFKNLKLPNIIITLGCAYIFLMNVFFLLLIVNIRSRRPEVK